MKKFILCFLILLFFPLNTFAEEINVAFTIDNKYVIPAMLTINSILKNNNSNSNYTFYIIEDLSSINKRKISNFIEKHNQKVKFNKFDYPEIQVKSFYHFNSSVLLARLSLPLILSDIHKVLYLDADTLVTTDLKELWEIDLSNNYVGMVQDMSEYMKHPNEPPCGYKFKHGYYNSGVILMNLDNMRKDKISEKMIDFVIKHKENFDSTENLEVCKYDHPDQDLINIILDGKIKSMDLKWNQQNLNCVNWPQEEGIFHLIVSPKPWNNLFTPANNITKRELIYRQYWENSSLKKYKKYYQIIILKTELKTRIKYYMELYKSRCRLILLHYDSQ